MRIGQGYDVHRLTEGRNLIIGGVNIEYEKGLLGHSDADVLVHAIIDALLGAAGLGDIGLHFPDSDERHKNADSLALLETVGGMIGEIINIDSTVIAQAPKLGKFREQMRGNIARALSIDANRVNVKFTTEEGLGFTGSGQGIAASAVCLIE